MAAGPGGLCIVGESLIDMLPRTTTDGEAAWRPCPGGAPFNALLAAKRLGLPVSYLATLSTDMFGEELHGILAREGVNLDLVTRLDRPTTLAFVKRTPGEGEKYAFFKENSADRGLTEEQVEKAMASNRFDAVHNSLGAVTLEDQQMKNAFKKFFQLAGKQQALRTFDPNLRTTMIAGDAASYKAEVEAFLAEVDVVKLSDDDLEFLYGKEVDHAEVVRKWFTLGPKMVIITAGAKGSIAYYPNPDSRKGIRGQIETPPPGTRPDTVDAAGSSAPVSDTVGCGDTFMGSFVSGMLSGATYEYGGRDAPLMKALMGKDWTETALAHLTQVLERASLCAAINASRAGCNPPTAAEAMAAGQKLGLSFAKPS